MNIPQLPTDNLYKFIAIFGLALIILGLVFSFYPLDYISIQLIRLNGELEALNAREEYLANGKPTEKELIEIRKELRKNLAEIKGKLEVISGLSKMSLRFSRYAAILTGFGLFLAGVGFYLWYVKFQKYQDKIIKSEAENIK